MSEFHRYIPFSILIVQSTRISDNKTFKKKLQISGASFLIPLHFVRNILFQHLLKFFQTHIGIFCRNRGSQ